MAAVAGDGLGLEAGLDEPVAAVAAAGGAAAAAGGPELVRRGLESCCACRVLILDSPLLSLLNLDGSVCVAIAPCVSAQSAEEKLKIAAIPMDDDVVVAIAKDDGTVVCERTIKKRNACECRLFQTTLANGMSSSRFVLHDPLNETTVHIYFLL